MKKYYLTVMIWNINTKLVDIWEMVEDHKMQHTITIKGPQKIWRNERGDNTTYAFGSLRHFVVEQSDDLEELMERASLECL